MSVTFNAGFNLYEGTIAERPVEGSTYFGAYYRATDTGAVFRCEDQPPNSGFSYTGTDGLYWNAAFNAGAFYAQLTVQDGDIIGNTTTETAFQSQLGLLGPTTIHVGVVFRISACFRYSSAAVLPGSLTLRFKNDGGGVIATLLGTAAYALPVAVSNKDICISGLLICDTEGQIVGHLQAAGSAIDNGAGAIIPVTAGLGSLDTISDQAFLFTAEFSKADVANTITMRQFVIEILNPTGG